MPTLGEIRAVGKPLDERSDRTGYIWLQGSKVLHPYSPFPIPRPHRKQSYPKLTFFSIDRRHCIHFERDRPERDRKIAKFIGFELAIVQSAKHQFERSEIDGTQTDRITISRWGQGEGKRI